MTRNFMEPRKRKYVKGYGYLRFARILSYKYPNKLLDTSTKAGLEAAKTAYQKIFNKTAEVTGELIRNEFAHSRKQLFHQRRDKKY